MIVFPLLSSAFNVIDPPAGCVQVIVPSAAVVFHRFVVIFHGELSDVLPLTNIVHSPFAVSNAVASASLSESLALS